MMLNITLEEGLNRLEVAIVKARMILDGYPTSALFTSEEYIKYYDCVYHLCVQLPPHVYSMQLYGRFQSAMEESIFSKVLPSIQHKNDAPFLIDLLCMWARYKVMAKCLGGIFRYLDRQLASFNRVAASLGDVSVQCFRNLVCEKLCQKFENAAIFLTHQDCAQKMIDMDLLKNVLNFFMEVGCEDSYYYDTFEKVLLANTASYYYRLAVEWLSGYSYVDYILKVEQCLNQEKERAKCLRQSTTERLLQVVQWELVGQNSSKLIEKQKTEHHDQATYQELLSRCASLNLGDGSSAPPS